MQAGVEVSRWLCKGWSKLDCTKDLEKRGFSEQEAIVIVSKVVSGEWNSSMERYLISQKQNKSRNDSRKNAESIDRLKSGLLFAAIGSGVLFLTYSFVSKSGGYYIIPYGAIGYGILNIYRGSIGLIKSQLSTFRKEK
jgi:hypothetical protein